MFAARQRTALLVAAGFLAGAAVAAVWARGVRRAKRIQDVANVSEEDGRIETFPLQADLLPVFLFSLSFSCRIAKLLALSRSFSSAETPSGLSRSWPCTKHALSRCR